MRLAVTASAVCLAVAGLPAVDATGLLRVPPHPATARPSFGTSTTSPTCASARPLACSSAPAGVTGHTRLRQADLVRRTATGRLSALDGVGTGDSHVRSDELLREYARGTAGPSRLVVGSPRRPARAPAGTPVRRADRATGLACAYRTFACLVRSGRIDPGFAGEAYCGVTEQVAPQ